MSVVSYSQFKKSMRYDAGFYHPEKIAIEKILSKNHLSIGDNFRPINKNVKPGGNIETQLIDLDNIRNNRIYSPTILKGWELGSIKKEILKNDLIISKLRSYLKQITINYDVKKILGSSELLVLRKKKTSKVNTETLLSFLLTDDVQNILKWSQEGSNHPRFSLSLLLAIKIPIPSDKIQTELQQILKNSNKLFQKSIEKYEEVKTIIKLELNLPEIYKKVEKVNIINYSEFISETRFDAQYFSSKFFRTIFLKYFKTESLNSLCKEIDTGSTPEKNQYSKNGYPILKMGCLTNYGMNWSKIEYVVDAHFQKSKKFTVKEDDVFFTSSAHAREHIGKKVDIVSKIPLSFIKDLSFVAEIMKISPKRNKINPYYLWAFLQTEISHKIFLNCIRGQTAHIYPKDIEKIDIPLINLQKQEQIEKLMQEYFDLTDKSTVLLKKAIRIMEKTINE
jgi:type I restriction enzyme, S subunit